jgi:hypothetical protein
MKKRISYLGTLAVLITGLVLGGVVSARPQEGFAVSKEEPVEKSYPAMGPGAPSGSALSNRPKPDCDRPAAVYCDDIPIEVIPPPGLEDDRDIFFTIIELSWDGSSGNNLDVAFWDNGQSTGSVQKLGSSASAKNPETMRIANASLGQYHIVVTNTSGANTGYKIKARITTDPFSNPNESLAPDPPKKKEEAKEEKQSEFVAPEDNSGTPTVVTPGAPVLDPVQTTGGDSDFDFDFSDLNDRITVNADDLGGELAGGAPTNTKKEPVSPAVLLASLIGAPALIAGSGAAYVWRRRQTLAV